MPTQLFPRAAAAAATLIAFGMSAAQATTFPTGGAFTPFNLTSTTYTQNFDTLASTGTTGTALPSGWQVTELNTGTNTNANSSYGVDDGGSTTGNSYSYGTDASTDRALGSLTSGTLTPVSFGTVFTNGLGSTISSLALSFTGEQWRYGTSAADTLTFEYAIGATDINGTSGWTAFTPLNFAAVKTGTVTGQSNMALNGNLATNQSARSGTLSNLVIGAGQSFAIRWTDTDQVGSDHGLAIDNFALTAGLSATAVPEPASWAMMIGGFGLVGGSLRTARRRAMPVTA